MKYQGKLLLTGLIVILASVPFVFSQETTEVKKVFNYAESLFASELTAPALESYLKVIQLYEPNEFVEPAEFKVAECYLRLGKFWLAADQLNKFVTKYPTGKFAEEAKIRLEWVRIYLQNQLAYSVDFTDSLCDQYIHRGNEYINWSQRNTQYGKLFVKEEFEEGLWWFNRVIKEFPNNRKAPQAMYDMANAYRRTDKKNDYETAISIYQKIIDTFPGTVWDDYALLAIGDVHRDNLQDNRKAVEAYKRIVIKYTKDPDNYFARRAKTQLELLGGK